LIETNRGQSNAHTIHLAHIMFSQGHSMVTMVAFHRPHTVSCYCSIAAMSLLCTVNEILSLISQNVKRSRDTSHIPFGGNISCLH